MPTVTLVPTYGRDYKSAAEVEAAFRAGKDFRVQDAGSQHNGAAANQEDLQAAGLDARIRYDRLTKVTIIKASA